MEKKKKKIIWNFDYPFSSTYRYSYKANAAEASEIFLDLPMSALNTAVYWVEYALRNGRRDADNNSLKPDGLSWYQYFAVDVIGFVIAVTASAVFSVYKSGKYLRASFTRSDGRGENSSQ